MFSGSENSSNHHPMWRNSHSFTLKYQTFYTFFHYFLLQKMEVCGVGDGITRVVLGMERLIQWILLFLNVFLCWKEKISSIFGLWLIQQLYYVMVLTFSTLLFWFNFVVFVCWQRIRWKPVGLGKECFWRIRTGSQESSFLSNKDEFDKCQTLASWIWSRDCRLQ